MFAGSVGRRFWEQHGQSWSNTAKGQDFVKMIDEEYQAALATEPEDHPDDSDNTAAASPSTTYRGDNRPRISYAHGVALGVVVGAVVGGAAIRWRKITAAAAQR
jgi:hypothetical protein